MKAITRSKKNRFKYNIRGKRRLEAWSGIFETEAECDQWYENYGKYHEKKGHKLVKVSCD